jgi:transcriptional regulator with XRE-family HTH domain
MNKQTLNRANQLIFARHYRQYTQTELASKINGLSQSQLSKYERGFGNLSDEKLKEIIEFLNFPFEFLDRKITDYEFKQ